MTKEISLRIVELIVICCSYKRIINRQCSPLMNYLITNPQVTHFSYPTAVFYIVALIGFSLILIRPYWAFLFSLFCFSARNFHAAVFTRTALFGQYLNLNDLLLWIALFAMIFDLWRRKETLWMPKILFTVFIIVVIGSIQSLVKYGTEEFVLRSIWSSAVFPLSFLASVNTVKNNERSVLFFWVLFVGATLAAVQHMIFLIYRTMPEVYSSISEVRTISYIMSGGFFLLISSLFHRKGSALISGRIFYWIGIAFIAVSYVLSFARSMYIAGTLMLIAIPLLIKGRFLMTGLYKIAGVVLLSVLLVGVLFPNFDFKTLLNHRLESFIYKDTFEESYESRAKGAATELELWLNGPIIVGEGASLPPEFLFAGIEITGALYHVAYSTYLVHYGLVGLFVYGCLLPIISIVIARKTFFRYFDDYRSNVALLAMACALFHVFTLPTSFNHMNLTSQVPGLIYGAVWGLSRNKIKNEIKEGVYPDAEMFINPPAGNWAHGNKQIFT